MATFWSFPVRDLTLNEPDNEDDESFYNEEGLSVEKSIFGEGEKKNVVDCPSN